VALRERVVDGQKIIEVNPFRCRMWSFHDRFEAHITEASCRAEIDSFERHGQLVPALGRALTDDPDYDVELIYGARRLFVARHINKPLLVEITDICDREAAIMMDIENRQRADISPYERGVSYLHMLRAGHFSSQEDIARALRVSTSRVSRLVRLARLPSVIVDAFASPLEIFEGWGLELVDALEDPMRRQRMVMKARAIAASKTRPIGREVYRSLLASAAHGRKPKAKLQDEVVKGHNGAPLFRISQRSNAVALLLPIDKVSVQTMKRIRGAMVDILDRACQKSVNQE
jgi:ParB family transcriptional regulator, chromosome partitioning protein